MTLGTRFLKKANMQGDHVQLPCRIEARPAKEFYSDSAMAKLSKILASTSQSNSVDLFVPGNEDLDPVYVDETTVGFTERRGKILRVSGMIDTDCRTSIGCAGAILTYLGRRAAVYTVAGQGAGSVGFQVCRIEMFSLRDSM